MAANESYLSSDKFGYDFVLATTQASINATMKKYLFKQKGETILCYRRNESKQTVPLTLDELNTLTGGVSLFDIPNGADDNDSRIKALQKARFLCAIKFSIGLPKNFDRLGDLPDIVELRPSTAMVKYRMYCADIHLTQLAFTVDGPEFKSVRQNEQRNRAWAMVTNVNLNQTSVEFQTLPKEVRDQIQNVGGEMFDISQLLFDLSSASLSDMPKIEGLDPDSEAYNILSSYFKNTYFARMKETGQPVLNYTVKSKPQTSTLIPTALNFHISPLTKETNQSLKTLEYVCATSPHTAIPSTRDFDWDWVTAADGDVHGTIAINRLTWANYLKDQLYQTAKNDCFVPYAKCSTDAWGTVSFGAWPTPGAQAEPSVEIPRDGDTLIKISWNKYDEDEAGVDGALGAIKLGNEYLCTVTARANKLTVTTWMKTFLFVRSLQTSNTANILDKTFVEEYELAVDGEGKMNSILTKQPVVDKSGTDRANAFSNFFTNTNEIFDSLKNQTLQRNEFNTHPIASLQGFIFPGGTTFAFKAFHFSNHQDLIASITYADPA
jgi:hypothetical protein